MTIDSNRCTGRTAEVRREHSRFQRQQASPGPIDPFKPIPWEAYSLISMDAPPRFAGLQLAFAVLCFLAVVGTCLWLGSH